MRSVVVVLPASMCAMMPMFRVFANGVCLGIAAISTGFGIRDLRFVGIRWDSQIVGRGKTRNANPRESQIPNPESRIPSPLPSIVSERLVRLCHPMRVFAFLHRAAAQIRRVEQLVGQLLLHRLAVAARARVADQP